MGRRRVRERETLVDPVRRPSARRRSSAGRSPTVTLSTTILPRFAFVKTQVTVSPAARAIEPGPSRRCTPPTGGPSRLHRLGHRVRAGRERPRVVRLPVRQREAVRVVARAEREGLRVAVRARLLLDDDRALPRVRVRAGRGLTRVEVDVGRLAGDRRAPVLVGADEFVNAHPAGSALRHRVRAGSDVRERLAARSTRGGDRTARDRLVAL